MQRMLATESALCEILFSRPADSDAEWASEKAVSAGSYGTAQYCNHNLLLRDFLASTVVHFKAA